MNMWSDFKKEAQFIDYMVIILGLGTAALLLIDRQVIGATGWIFYCLIVFFHVANKAIEHEYKRLLDEAMSLLKQKHG